MGITALASPLLDNVTIVMLVAPVTVVICNRLGIAATPYIIAEILAANIGGAATLIGDPPNIIIGSRAGLSFNDFLVHMTPIVVVIFAVFVLLTRVMFRSSFHYDPERVADVMSLQERRAITDPALLRRCLVVLTFVVAGFCLHSVLHLEPSIVALVGAGVMMLISRADVDDVMREVEWPTLVFFAGLFVMVAGLVHTGVIDAIGTWVIAAVGDNYLGAAAALIFGSAILGAFFDNIPYTATMRRSSRNSSPRSPTRDRAGALVGVRARRRFRRQRHRGGGQRERRGTGDRRPDGAPDLVLAVHPLRHRRHRAQHGHGVRLRVVALLPLTFR